MKSELEKFHALVEQIEIAMMTTRRPDGHLESAGHGQPEEGGGR